MKSIYDLKLHEQTTIENDDVVIRVPNGWIYIIRTNPEHPVFVPYSSEFLPNERLIHETNSSF